MRYCRFCGQSHPSALECPPDLTAAMVETEEAQYELLPSDDGESEWWRRNRVHGERTGDHRSRVLDYGGLELHAALTALAAALNAGRVGSGEPKTVEGVVTQIDKSTGAVITPDDWPFGTPVTVSRRATALPKEAE